MSSLESDAGFAERHEVHHDLDGLRIRQREVRWPIWQCRPARRTFGEFEREVLMVKPMEAGCRRP